MKAAVLALALSALAASAASAYPHHHMRVCTFAHHHRICRWR